MQNNSSPYRQPTSETIVIREAREDELSGCAAIPPLYTTRTVWRVAREGEMGRPAGGETLPLLTFGLQQAWLPQARILRLPSSMVPLNQVWGQFTARLVAISQDDTNHDDAVLDDADAQHDADNQHDADDYELAKQKSQICGYLLIHVLPDQCQAMIARFLVDPPMRRRGVGKALIRAAHHWATHEHRFSLLAHAPLRNVPGITFYQRRGFRISGVMQHFYPNREDALLLGQTI